MLKKSSNNQPPATPQLFPIVGVGASAGGLDAFKRLLKAIPVDSGMAYVLVQHLDPSHESILPEILARSTSIPVHEITDDIHLAPDHIYIIPSIKILTSTDGVLKLTVRDKKIQNYSIDIFFTSLAEVHTNLAVGIVLSGTGKDGTLGLKAIKEHTGITIAQSPESAAYDSMPKSAIDSGVVDFILAPEDIPAQLLQINSTILNLHNQAEADLPKDDGVTFKKIISLIGLNSGVDFTYYKQPTPRRRIARRMAITKISDLAGYLKFLRNNKSELNSLFQDMLIPVTSFFRDQKTFLELSKSIIPLILKNKSEDEPIRVWIAGCSTGEEAYSVAICIQENLNKQFSRRRVQIFGSDISEAAIKKARTGIYSKADVRNIPEEVLKEFFVKNNEGYEVSKLIRDICVFAPHNFLKDPPFAKMDLISCRNVLIYMDNFLQKKALSTFHYALKENGFLILGKSETTGSSSDLFAVVSKHEKIYSRKAVPGRFMHVASDRKEILLTVKNKVLKNEVAQTDVRKSAEAMLLSNYTPAGIVVNDQFDIVHIHGSVSQYIEQPSGKPTLNLLKLAKEGLAFELRSTLHKAKNAQSSIIKRGIPAGKSGDQIMVDIEIIKLNNLVEPGFLILFSKTNDLIAPEEIEGNKSASQKVKSIAQLRIQQVENELAQTRDDMRSITEDQEAANEELQSANEELLSSSEEMQSLNEELETSKEELQSTNEELLIVNQELLDKQDQLNASRFYAEAIVTTMREPLVVLDKSLRIKTANASFYKKFNVKEEEIEGQLFYEIKNNRFDNHHLRSLLEKILPQKKRIDDFELVLNFPLTGEATILLNASQIVNEKTAEQLILLALEDITERVRVEKLLKDSEARSRAFVESNIVAVCFTNVDDATIFEANDSFLNMLGYSRKDLRSGKINWLNYTPKEFHQHDYNVIDSLKRGETPQPYEKEIICTDGKRIFVLKGRAVINATEIMSVFVDITERKMAEKKLKLFSGELEVQVKERTSELHASHLELENSIRELIETNKRLDQFTFVASHDLQEPLRKILTFSNRIRDKHKDKLIPEIQNYLHKIEIASIRMTTLIQDLLNYARITNIDKLFTTVDLNAIYISVLDDFELLIQEKNAVINCGNLPVINALPLQMNQLFYNLISNALKFSKEDVSPIISITSRKLSKTELKKHPGLVNTGEITYFEITFEDNGIGFDQKYAEQIFVIFQRLNQQSLYVGTGIGLALTKKIAENHNGQIFGAGIEDSGATFRVILPLIHDK